MAENNLLNQVALGFDQAKQRVFEIMAKFFPKIETSKSTLVNAFVSGLATLYAMFQVFTKLFQDELRVSTAREIESLYRLIPFVGINLPQPTTLKIETTLIAQDVNITQDSDPELYLDGADPFADTNGNNFFLRTKNFIKKRAFSFPLDQDFRSKGSTGRVIQISLAKFTGEELVPASFFAAESITIEAPYKVENEIRRLLINFDKSTIGGVANPTDVGSDVPADVSLPGSTFNHLTGDLKLTLSSVLPAKSFNDADLRDQPINVTFTGRSIFRKDIDTGPTDVDTVEPGVTESYFRTNIFNQASVQKDATSKVEFEPSFSQSELNARVTAVILNDGVLPSSLILRSKVETDIVWDFTDAEELVDVFWGNIFKKTVTFNSKIYSAYLLDEFIGLIFFEDAKALDTLGTRTPADYEVEYSSHVNSKTFLEQLDNKVKNVSPPVEFDFDTFSFILEDEDPILFEELEISITDTAFSATEFEETESLAFVSGDINKTFFEVVIQSPTKVKIKFEDGAVDYRTVENLVINYKTVKQLDTFPAGIQLTGASTMKDRDQDAHIVNGNTIFNFSGENKIGQAGVAGIPSLESLRSTLEKAAFTLTNIVTRINYEAAIQTFFIGQGFDARIKVFQYEDFGLTFLDSTAGNIVFFIGLVNKFPNSNFILTMPQELDSAFTGGDVGQFTRAELDAAIPGSLTDVSQNFIKIVGADSDDVNNIQDALRKDMVLTNTLLSDETFIQIWAVYFKLRIRPKDQFTFAEASEAAILELAKLFTWDQIRFVRDLNISDIYNILDDLPEIEKLTFDNFSHFRNDSPFIKQADIVYKTILTAIDSITTLTTLKLGMDESDNKLFLPFNTEPSLTAVASGNKITRSTGSWITDGFFIGQSVNISGFATAGNNGTSVAVTGVTATDLSLDASDITLVNEGPISPIIVKDAFDLKGAGIIVGRRIIVASENITPLGTFPDGFDDPVAQINTTIELVASGNIVRRSSGSWITDRFIPGQRINIRGFSTNPDPILAVKITAVATFDLTLDTNDVVLVNEGPTGSITVAKNLITNALITNVSTDAIFLDSSEVQLFEETTPRFVIVNDQDERDENPLFDFSNAETSRLIKVDVLALAGIETEPY